MPARGNSDAAARLRRAKSTSSVTKPVPRIRNYDAVSTYDDAKTAATRAYGAAQGFIADGCGTARAKRKTKSEGPGSHLARQRTHPRRTAAEVKTTSPQRTQCYEDSRAEAGRQLCLTPPPSLASETPPSKVTVFVDHKRERTMIEQDISPSARLQKRVQGSLMELETLQPPHSKMSRQCPEFSASSGTRPDEFEDVPLMGSPREIENQGMHAIESTHSHAGEQGSCPTSSRTQKSASRPKYNAFFTMPRLRTKSSGNGIATLFGSGTGADETSKKVALKDRMQRMPSSLSVVKAACKRTFRKPSRDASVQSELPSQQVVPRRSHQFGSSRLSHHSIVTVSNHGTEPNETIEPKQDRPPTPPRHTWFATKGAEQSRVGSQTIDGPDPQESRLTSWTNTSKFGTATGSGKWFGSNMAAKVRNEDRGTEALQRLHLRHQPSSSSVAKLRVSYRNSSNTLRSNNTGIDTKRVYSALIKRISESDRNGDTAPVDWSDVSDANEEKKIDLLRLDALSPSPAPTPKASRATIRVIDGAESPSVPQNTSRSAKPTNPRQTIISPSIYSSHHPDSNGTPQTSTVCLPDRVRSPTGTAVVSASKPYASWSLEDEHTDAHAAHLVTSGDWRD